MSDKEKVKQKIKIIEFGKLLKILALLFPSVIAIGVAIFFYSQWQQAQEQVNQVVSENQGMNETQKEIAKAVKVLEKSVLLPEGETPTISTITNKEELIENREFFENAINGDQVLVYHQAKKAFLYRPSTNKLINLAPINISGDVNGDKQIKTSDNGEIESISAEENKEEIESENESVSELVSIELRNGTETVGVTYIFETKLREELKDQEVKITTRRNAGRLDYEKSLVVVGNLVQKSVGQQIASVLGLSVVTLPSGEDKVQADILIILGKDQVE